LKLNHVFVTENRHTHSTAKNRPLCSSTDLWDLLILLWSEHVNVNSLRHQQCSEEIVETKDFRRNRPIPRQLVQGKDTDGQQAAANTTCQPNAHNKVVLHKSVNLVTV